MIAALSASEVDTLVLILGIVVLLAAAVVAYRTRELVVAAFIALIGVILLFLAS